MPPEPPKDDRAHLADMAESARLAVQYLTAVSLEQFAAILKALDTRTQTKTP